MTEQQFGTCEFNARSGLWTGKYLYYTALSHSENRIRAWLRNLELGEHGLTSAECHNNAKQDHPHEDTDRIVVTRDPEFTAKKKIGTQTAASFGQEPQNEGVLLTRDEAMEWLKDGDNI